MSLNVDRLDTVRRYAGLEAPVDGSLERVAAMAAKVFSTPMATVSIVDAEQVRILASAGLDGVTRIGLDPGLAASAVLGLDPYVVNDAATDPRTLSHPFVRGDLGVRFYAAAPIVTPDGSTLGTVDVLDRKRHRRLTGPQLDLLVDLAALVSHLLESRRSAQELLRVEQARLGAEIAHLKSRPVDVAADRPDVPRPTHCQFGGTAGCTRPAEMKVADSWGDSAWGCWHHAEDALINVPSVFLAIDNADGLAAYRARPVTAPPV